jgi:hypothetical protein
VENTMTEIEIVSIVRSKDLKNQKSDSNKIIDITIDRRLQEEENKRSRPVSRVIE